jgi:adenosylcobinamide kinase / adenosylcobinamide-phosphate guanylyltransferase
MSLTLLLGGARSGKSALAVREASAWEGPIVFVATADARNDVELAARIERHRAERPSDWDILEEPLEVEAVLARVSGDSFLVLDCLTLWTANALEAGWNDAAVERVAATIASLAAGRRSPTVVISNEVGMGIVPPTPLGRRYRDLLGRVNTIFAAAADRTYLVVAGRRLELR